MIRLVRPALSRVTPVLLGALLSAACSGAPTRPTGYTFPTAQGGASDAATAWLSGKPAPAASASAKAQPQGVEALFTQAERAYWSGDMERAFTTHLALLRRDAAHPLARLSAARLNELHDDVADFDLRVQETLSTIRLGAVNPVTAAYLSMVGQRALWTSWDRQRDPKPFDAAGVGLPQRWRVSPLISPWRLTDFDTPHPIEQQPQLAETYLSPQIAEDVPLNHHRTRRFIAPSINLSPKLGKKGTYYLETFAQVSGNSARKLWVYGNFSGAARVWIDGKEVLTRREQDYQPGKVFRRVELSPGAHRVLVKLAYQPSYRDWFDLAFLADDATPLSGSGLSFSEQRPASGAAGSVKVIGDARTSAALEPIHTVTPAEAPGASAMTLYLAALAAYYNREPEAFDTAAEALIKARPDFAPIHGLSSLHAQTLWEVPSRLRDATALSALRRAHQLDPDSPTYAIRLGALLLRQNRKKEVSQLYERAAAQAVDADGKLRYILPLRTWARFLESQSWEVDAERAWANALKLAPGYCEAAKNLQKHMHARGYYPKPETITPEHARCPELREAWVAAQEDQTAEELAMARTRAARYPDQVSAQLNLVQKLVAAGKDDEANKRLADLPARFPENDQVVQQQVQQALLKGDREAAIKALDAGMARSGYDGWALWQRAALKDELPLASLMKDGVAIARNLSQRPLDAPAAVGTRDEAYYAIDFAARHYLPDQSSITLTHTMVRVMTKNAIDRFGEVQVPASARVLRARTIKADGTVLTPQKTAGKATLSMPGLAPGDFVELAYIQFEGPSSLARSRAEGTKFFFKMKDISSLHSEYVIINPRGEVTRQHDAPEGERFELDGQPALRFVRKDSPRPRGEPSSVPVEEYLPWIQLHHQGIKLDSFELGRRSYQETLRDNMKTSVHVDRLLKQWRDQLKGQAGEALVRGLFYKAASYFPSGEVGALNVELSHAVLTREGSPLALLKRAYDAFGIKAEIYLAKSRFQDPQPRAFDEFLTYRGALLRVEQGDKVWWVLPAHQDSMFGAVGTSYIGQPAVCISCKALRREVVKPEQVVSSDRKVQIKAALDAQGTLRGTIRHEYSGERAANARRLLRERGEASQRAKLMEALVAEHLGGSTVKKFSLDAEDDPTRPLIITAEVERPRFAQQPSPNTLVIDAPIFRVALATAFAALPARVTPMLLGVDLSYIDELELELPRGKRVTLRSQQGKRELNTAFGDFTREVTLTDNTLRVRSAIDLGVQRVAPADYATFQRWAYQVETSSRVTLVVE